MGRAYQIPMAILRKSPYFLEVFKHNPYAGYLSQPVVVLHRSPMLFEHALAYMVDPSYCYLLKRGGSWSIMDFSSTPL